MAPARPTPDHEQIRAAVTARYSGLARAARAGQPVADCGPGPFAAGCFGPAGYADTSELPDGAVGPASAAGTPSPSPSCIRGRPSWTSAPAAASTCCCPPAGFPRGDSLRPGRIPGHDPLARENAAQAGVTNAEFLHGHIEDIPLPEGYVDVVISNCVINLSADKAPRAGRDIARCPARRAARDQQRHRRRRP